MPKTKIIIFLLILLPFAVGIYFYPQMPEKIASHWNAAGEADGYMPKFWGLFLIPVISLVMALFFLLIPKLDPLKENIEKFKKSFEVFIIFFLLFLFYLEILVIVWNLGTRFNFIYALAPAFAILFYYVGVMVGRAKRNWFIGIRTPWTLSSEIVWDKTHKIGGKLFKASALVALIGIFFGKYAVYFIVLPVILTALYACIYSYFEYKKVKPL